MNMLKILFGFFVFVLFSSLVFASSDCPSYREDCMLEEQASKIDTQMYQTTLDVSDALFFDQESFLRSSNFQNNPVATHLNLVMIKILAIFFQLWYVYIIYLFYSSKGDLELIEKAKDSLKRFLFALGAVAVSAILFLLFSSFLSSLNATIGESVGVQNIIAPDPYDYGEDSGILSAILRIPIILGLIIVAIPLFFFKMIESLLLPLFTLFLFLHFAKKEASSRFILDMLVFSMLIPGIFFLFMMIIYALIAPFTSGLISTLIMGNVTLFLAGILLTFLLIKIAVGAVVRSLIVHVSGAVFQGLSKGLKSAYKRK